MNKTINSLYLNTQKLLRENEQKDNTIVKNKTRNFVIENTCLNMSKEIFFEGSKDSILQIGLNAKCDVNCTLKVYLNNVEIVNEDFTNLFSISKGLYIDKNNVLKFELFLDSFSDIKLLINLTGDFYLHKENLINLKNIEDNLYFIKGGYLSNNNDILSYTTYMNNNSYYNNVKYLDYNVNYENQTNIKNLLLGVYINASNQIVLNTQDNNVVLDIDGITDACIISSNDINYYFNIVYIVGGKLYFRSYNSDMSISTNKQLSSLNNSYFKQVKSISSDVPTKYFWAKSQDDFWYLINISVESGNVVSVREFVKCMDVASYYYNGEHIIIELIENGIKVDKFEFLNLTGKSDSTNYMNVDNAFIFDNCLYLISTDVVQEIHL